MMKNICYLVIFLNFVKIAVLFRRYLSEYVEFKATLNKKVEKITLTGNRK